MIPLDTFSQGHADESGRVGVAALWAEKMKKSVGVLNASQPVRRVNGSATIVGLQAGFDLFNVGSGLARVAQS